MPIAVECYFDVRTEARIRRLRSVLHDQGVPWQPGTLDARPHISLALIREDAADSLLNLLHAYAGEQPPVEIQLHALGTFPTPENILFLSPAPSTALLAAHRNFHARLKETGLASSPYYLPEGWVPHCTVEMRIPESLFPAAFQTCKEAFQPLHGRLEEIGLVQVMPYEERAAIRLRGG